MYLYKWSYVIHDNQSAQILQKQNGRNVYVIKKTRWPPGYQHNGFAVTHAFAGKSMSYRKAIVSKVTATSCGQVHELSQSHCGDKWEGTLSSEK